MKHVFLKNFLKGLFGFAFAILPLTILFAETDANREEKNCYPFFIEIGGGYSFPWNTNLKVDTSFREPVGPFWDPAVQGYNDDLSNEPVFEAGIGYHATAWLDIYFSSAYRGTYQYKKSQRMKSDTLVFDPLGSKTRYFDLDNLNFLFNVLIHGRNCFSYKFGSGMAIGPFIGGGIGVSRHKLFNFHAVLNKIDSESATKQIAAVMPTYEKYALAAEGIVGLSWVITKRTWLDVGYRLYYGGKFKSNDYTTDITATTPDKRGVWAPPWEGRLLTNEVFVRLGLSM